MTVNELGQFWIDVIAAHDKVATNHNNEIIVERDGKSAEVWFDRSADLIVIEVAEADTETRDPLPVPGSS